MLADRSGADALRTLVYDDDGVLWHVLVGDPARQCH